MEGLVLLFGEFLCLLLIPSLVLVVDLLVLVSTLVVEGLSLLIAFLTEGTLAFSSKSGKKDSPAPESDERDSSGKDEVGQKRAGSILHSLFSFLQFPAVRRWLWRLGVGSGVVFVLLLVSAFVINGFFFESALQTVLNLAEGNTGIATTFESAEGNLWSGEAELAGVKIRRKGHPRSNFDLEVETLVFDVAVGDLLRGKTRLEKLWLDGLEGDYERLQAVEKVQPRRHFVIENFQIRDAEVELVDRIPQPDIVTANLKVASLEMKRFRSFWAAFDILFRSKIRGSIDGQEYVVTSREIPDGRETRWQVRGLPVRLATPYLGEPFSWIREGRLDVDVEDRWSLGEKAEIEMHWSFVFEEIQAEVPNDLSRTEKIVAVPTVAFFNKHSRRLPLSFDVVIDEKHFEGKASPLATDFAETIAQSASRALGKVMNIAPKKLKKKGKDLFDNFKDYLDRRRKGK